MLSPFCLLFLPYLALAVILLCFYFSGVLPPWFRFTTDFLPLRPVRPTKNVSTPTRCVGEAGEPPSAPLITNSPLDIDKCDK